ncbi:TonB domain-containing protein [Pelosinus fermentans JBW45]|uniref:TonB domain-containing protein n=2 Tax=Pelosinus TaxID=365348 RepID=I9DGE6_9FIRM|nr:TonB domain-containing protein [Pelosinus fermentans JBW45]
MKKMRFIVVLMLLLTTGMSVSALAKDKPQVTPPQIITLAAISLPQDVKEKYAEQTVAVKVKATISVYGTVDGEVKIITSSGDAAFDNAVIESIQKSVFSPAYSDTTAISSSILLPLHVKVEKIIPEEQANGEAQPIAE